MSILGWIIYLRRPHGNRLFFPVFFVLLAFFSLGAVRLSLFQQPTSNDVRNFVGEDRILATLRGRVLTEVFEADKNDWKFGRYSWSGGGASFYLTITHAETETGFQSLSGTVRVQVEGELEGIEPGDTVQMYCWLSRFEPPLNPGQFDVADYMHRRGVYVSATVKNAAGVERMEKASPASFPRLQKRLRELTTTALVDDSIAQDPARGILEALILGQRKNQSPEVFEAFRKTGLAHFICLSGLHFGILALFIWWISRIFGLSKRWRAVVCLGVTILYMLIIPPRAATLRAAILVWFMCLATLVFRHPRPLNTLCFAAIGMLLIRPMDVFAPDWQLSYGTVAGILLFYNPIYNRILTVTLDRLPDRWDLSLTGRLCLGGIARVLESTTVGLSAWLGGAGILLYHFGTINPWSAVFTVLASPVVFFILMFGFLKILVGFWLPTLGALLAVVTAGLAQLLVWSVTVLRNVPFSEIVLGHIPGLIIAMIYICFLWPRLFPSRRLLYRRLVFASILGTVLLPFAWNWNKEVRFANLEVTVLSVGHGQAIHIALPDSRHLLFDAGSLTVQDPGRRVILPYLRYRGIRDLEAILISHDDIDHLNAIPEVVAGIHVHAVLSNSAVCRQAQTLSSAGFLRQCLEQEHLEIRPIDHVLWKNDPVQWNFLWPTERIMEDKAVSDNDKSQVVLLEYAGRRILLCSDIERAAQAGLLELYPQLQSDIVIMPHHGSATNLLDDFVPRLNPEAIIVSCSRQRSKTAFHPPASVKSYYTPTDGAVSIQITSDGNLSIHSFRGQ